MKLLPWLMGLCLTAAGTETPAAAPPSDVVAVRGTELLRGGRAWVPRGVQIVGFVAPEAELVDGYRTAHRRFGDEELAAIRSYGADTIRFQVSQAGLDPRSGIHDPHYPGRVRTAVRRAREHGFSVIVSMQDQPPSGQRTPLGMPSEATARAWTTLAPMLRADRGILAELFNEPSLVPTPHNWRIWAHGGDVERSTLAHALGGGMALGAQQLIDHLRAHDVRNVLIVGGLSLAKTFAGAPQLHDPRGQLAYGVHPYFGRIGGTAGHDLNNTRASWQAAFGDFAGAHPVIATEWNATSHSVPPCTADIPQRAADLVEYLRERRIGLVGFTFDLFNTLIVDWSWTPTSYRDFACGKPGGGAGELIRDSFLNSR